MFRPRTAAAVAAPHPDRRWRFFLEGAGCHAPALRSVLSIVANRYVDSLQGADIYGGAWPVRELNDSELLAPKQNDESIGPSVDDIWRGNAARERRRRPRPASW